MMHNKENNSLSKNETGVVAIFVTLIMMVILSIMILGFSQISRREVTDALNRQLSTSAFYAAESGVNDAYSIIYSSLTTNTPNPKSLPNMTSCKGPDYIPSTNNILDPGSNTQYTCLLVNTSPTSLGYTPAAGQPVISDIKSSSVIKNITIAWQSQDPKKPYSASCQQYRASITSLPPNDFSHWPQNCPPIIRVDLVPINSASFSADDLQQYEKILFLYPQSSAPTINSNLVQNGDIYAANCNTTCSSTINVSTMGKSGTGSSEFYVRLQYIYGSAPQFNLSACGLGSCPITFQGVQAQIDATGETQNVLRRIQVTISLNPSATGTYSIPAAPSFAIQTNASLCKSLIVGTNPSTGNDFAYEKLTKTIPQDIYNIYKTSNITFDVSTPKSPSDPFQLTDPCNPYL